MIHLFTFSISISSCMQIKKNIEKNVKILFINNDKHFLMVTYSNIIQKLFIIKHYLP
jgi:hypothetical protein